LPGGGDDDSEPGGESMGATWEKTMPDMKKMWGIIWAMPSRAAARL
jgi:hypothetical protein